MERRVEIRIHRWIHRRGAVGFIDRDCHTSATWRVDRRSATSSLPSPNEGGVPTGHADDNDYCLAGGDGG